MRPRCCVALPAVVGALPMLFLSGCAAGNADDGDIFLADGPLTIRVVHPLPDEPPPASGSDYLMGSLGNGRASLWIDGVPVPVHPNGAFLAYRPAPPDGRTGYRITAVLGSDTVHHIHPVARNSESSPRPASPVEDVSGTAGIVGVVGSLVEDRNGERRELVGSLTVGGPYEWFFLPGTRVLITGEAGEQVRVRILPGLEVWVARRDVSPAPGAAEYRLPRISSAHVRPDAEWVDVIIPASDPPAYRAVELTSGIDLELYGVWTAAQPSDAGSAPEPWIQQLTSSRIAPGRVRYQVRLSGPLYGYSLRWSEGQLILRLRRPPRINPKHPLRGLVVAVDPGHPPAGAVGPTGLEEHEVTLAVAQRLKPLLEARGAHVVMTRIDHRPVSLGTRTLIADRANAHALVSIHADAVPSGANPFHHNGTTTYFYRQQSAPLGRAVHWAMIERLGLPDRGVRRGNLAVVRRTWMPSVLCEGATMTIPEQEMALRTPEFREAYAEAVVSGLEHYFRALERHQRARDGAV